jgi:hypothetical protein
MIKRFIGVSLIFISATYIPIIGAIAVNSSFSIAEKGIYSAIVYGLSWGVLFLGIYWAGPELVEKLKNLYKKIKSKIFNK